MNRLFGVFFAVSSSPFRSTGSSGPRSAIARSSSMVRGCEQFSSRSLQGWACVDVENDVTNKESAHGVSLAPRSSKFHVNGWPCAHADSSWNGFALTTTCMSTTVEQIYPKLNTAIVAWTLYIVSPRAFDTSLSMPPPRHVCKRPQQDKSAKAAHGLPWSLSRFITHLEGLLLSLSLLFTVTLSLCVVLYPIVRRPLIFRVV